MKCGKPLEQESQEYCRDCERQPADFEAGRSVWVHCPPVSTAVYQLKYQNKRAYGKVFAIEMARCFSAQIHRWQIQEIIPVPLHPKRRRRRGYNQAELLAEELGEILRIPVNKEAVFRIRNTSPQKMLDDRERTRNLKGAFGVSKQWKPLENVLIIDDIYTTGSTIRKVSTLLRRAGAEKVYFLTVSIGQGIS